MVAGLLCEKSVRRWDAQKLLSCSFLDRGKEKIDEDIYLLRQGLLVDSNSMIHITTNALSLFGEDGVNASNFSHIIRCLTYKST